MVCIYIILMYTAAYLDTVAAQIPPGLWLNKQSQSLFVSVMHPSRA